MGLFYFKIKGDINTCSPIAGYYIPAPAPFNKGDKITKAGIEIQSLLDLFNQNNDGSFIGKSDAEGMVGEVFSDVETYVKNI